MSEELEDLKQQEKQLLQESKWDELIPVYTEMIALKGELKDEAATYHNRGVAYSNTDKYTRAIMDFDKAVKLNPLHSVSYWNRGRIYRLLGDNDHAIANFNETIRLESNDALAYYERGIAYANKAQYSEAIADFDKATELNPNDAVMYCGRGVTYSNMGNHDAAIDDFDKAIELDPKNLLAYQNCAFAYRHLGQHEQAIRLAGRAIELDPTCASACRERGSAYLHKDRYGQALGDFDRAIKHDPESTTRFAGMYIVSRITSIYGTGEDSQREKAFKFFYKLVDAIRVIQEKLFCGPESVQELAHYTTLYALRSLAKQSPFRLSNGAYMNDPEEGRTFFEIMEDVHDTNVKDSFYKKTPYPSPAYIGSFAKVAPSRVEPKDKLFLWRTYGKHDVEEAAGACLIFKHNGRNFAETCPSAMGYMPQRTIDDTSQQISKPALYRVVYRNDKGEELSKELSQLSESLKQIEAHVLQRANDKEEQLRNFVCELLDSIRFLFKKDHYKEEQEVRIIEARRAEDDETWEPDGVKVDTERIPPRFYLEAGDLRFSEVILGPQARGIREWTRWLKEQDEDLTVKKSKIKYGERYP